MYVYVRNLDGMALMPCTPAKARKLLEAGKAKTITHRPFTIQLTWQCEGQVQPVTCGIDKGSSTTGLACVSNGQVLLAADIHHRRDVKDKIQDRRDRRKSRRARRWYRPKRFLNRASSKLSGRLPPSIKTNVEEVIRVVWRIPLPISQIVVEDVQVDIARLNNPHLVGSQYQDPSRLDENLRIACLMRDGYKGLHQGKITLKVIGVSGHLDQIAQRTMQGKSYLYAALGKHTTLSKLFGYQTATFRKWRRLPKTHIIDALCIATYHTGAVISVPVNNLYQIGFRPRQTRKQYHSLPQKGKGRVRYQVNDELAGLHKGDIVLVKNRYVKHINSIYSEGRLAFRRVQGEPPSALARDCRLLERERTIFWEKRA